MKKIFYNLISIFLFSIIFIFSLCSTNYCADPKLITTIKKAFEEISSWILKISTPAAAVSVASGFLMQKFSFGDEERIRTGKKLVRNSLISYGFILCLDLVLAAIKALVG